MANGPPPLGRWAALPAASWASCGLRRCLAAQKKARGKRGQYITMLTT
jgi:hypothetical protein